MEIYDREAELSVDGLSFACFNCGRATAKHGRRAKDGVRFCMAPGCRAAKQRYDNKRRRREFGIEMDERPCFHCGRTLAPRMKRVTDLPYGRWCQRPTCQRSRVVTIDRYQREKTYFVSLPAEDCEACGRLGARLGLQHIKPDWRDGWCSAIGDAPVTELLGFVAREYWPHEPKPDSIEPDEAKEPDDPRRSSDDAHSGEDQV